VAAFLEGRTDDRRIAELLAGLACVDFKGLVETESQADLDLPPTYLLLKPFFMVESRIKRLLGIASEVSLRLPSEAAARLAAGDVQKAVDTAWFRLRIAGLKVPGRKGPQVFDVDGGRLLAALMVPLSPSGERMLWKGLTGIFEKEEASHGA
jgi:CRISPR-associated protein Csx17